jgi:hypothetical protein
VKIGFQAKDKHRKKQDDAQMRGSGKFINSFY